jgi:cytochrome c-type biogenesis protein CcmE
VLTAFEDNMVFFFSPTQVAAREAPQGRTFRIGGMVLKRAACSAVRMALR